MLIAGFDTETTGRDPQIEQIVQVGAVLWDTEAKTKKAKVKLDMLIQGPHIPPLSEEVTQVHGITDADLHTYGYSFEDVMAMLHESIFGPADAIIAHNGNMFDRPIYEQNCKNLGVEPIGLEKLWIDSMCDIEFPAHITTRKLVHLAAEHGVVNPFPHDALCDVMTLLKIADLYPWDTAIRYAKSPTLTIRAMVSFSEKELAKKQAFRWDGANKEWLKSIKEFQLADATKAATDAGFKITVQKGDK